MRAAPALFLLMLVLLAQSCGVKGPPLPPLATTPERSDRLEVPRAVASPAPF